MEEPGESISTYTADAINWLKNRMPGAGEPQMDISEDALERDREAVVHEKDVIAKEKEGESSKEQEERENKLSELEGKMKELDEVAGKQAMLHEITTNRLSGKEIGVGAEKILSDISDAQWLGVGEKNKLRNALKKGNAVEVNKAYNDLSHAAEEYASQHKGALPGSYARIKKNFLSAAAALTRAGGNAIGEVVGGSAAEMVMPGVSKGVKLSFQKLAHSVEHADEYDEDDLYNKHRGNLKVVVNGVEKEAADEFKILQGKLPGTSEGVLKFTKELSAWKGSGKEFMVNEAARDLLRNLAHDAKVVKNSPGVAAGDKRIFNELEKAAERQAARLHVKAGKQISAGLKHNRQQIAAEMAKVQKSGGVKRKGMGATQGSAMPQRRAGMMNAAGGGNAGVPGSSSMPSQSQAALDILDSGVGEQPSTSQAQQFTRGREIFDSALDSDVFASQGISLGDTIKNMHTYSFSADMQIPDAVQHVKTTVYTNCRNSSTFMPMKNWNSAFPDDNNAILYSQNVNSVWPLGYDSKMEAPMHEKSIYAKAADLADQEVDWNKAQSIWTKLNPAVSVSAMRQIQRMTDPMLDSGVGWSHANILLAALQGAGWQAQIPMVTGHNHAELFPFFNDGLLHETLDKHIATVGIRDNTTNKVQRMIWPGTERAVEIGDGRTIMEVGGKLGAGWRKTSDETWQPGTAFTTAECFARFMGGGAMNGAKWPFTPQQVDSGSVLVIPIRMNMLNNYEQLTGWFVAHMPLKMFQFVRRTNRIYQKTEVSSDPKTGYKYVVEISPGELSSTETRGELDWSQVAWSDARALPDVVLFVVTDTTSMQKPAGYVAQMSLDVNTSMKLKIDFIGMKKDTTYALTPLWPMLYEQHDVLSTHNRFELPAEFLIRAMTTAVSNWYKIYGNEEDEARVIDILSETALIWVEQPKQIITLDESYPNVDDQYQALPGKVLWDWNATKADNKPSWWKQPYIATNAWSTADTYKLWVRVLEEESRRQSSATGYMPYMNAWPGTNAIDETTYVDIWKSIAYTIAPSEPLMNLMACQKYMNYTNKPKGIFLRNMAKVNAALIQLNVCKAANTDLIRQKMGLSWVFWYYSTNSQLFNNAVNYEYPQTQLDLILKGSKYEERLDAITNSVGKGIGRQHFKGTRKYWANILSGSYSNAQRKMPWTESGFRSGVSCRVNPWAAWQCIPEQETLMRGIGYALGEQAIVTPVIFEKPSSASGGATIKQRPRTRLADTKNYDISGNSVNARAMSTIIAKGDANEAKIPAIFVVTPAWKQQMSLVISLTMEERTWHKEAGLTWYDAGELGPILVETVKNIRMLTPQIRYSEALDEILAYAVKYEPELMLSGSQVTLRFKIPTLVSKESRHITTISQVAGEGSSALVNSYSNWE